MCPLVGTFHPLGLRLPNQRSSNLGWGAQNSLVGTLVVQCLRLCTYNVGGARLLLFRELRCHMLLGMENNK